jgi:hypothetical protein
MITDPHSHVIRTHMPSAHHADTKDWLTCMCYTYMRDHKAFMKSLMTISTA